MKKKIATILTAAVIGATAFTTIVSAASGDITVVSREDGSGTRGAFVELFGIEEEKDGEKVDMTTDEASVTNSTSVVLFIFILIINLSLSLLNRRAEHAN